MAGTVKIVVLGAGPGGYVAALRAAARGAEVTLVEKDLVGGTCLNRGCIPTKTLLASAEALSTARRGGEFGFEIDGEVRPNFERMMERKSEVVTRLRESIEVLLKKAGVTAVRGTGRIDGDLDVIVTTGDEGSEEALRLSADRIIIATGSEPARLPMFDFGHQCILTSTSALALTRIPESLLIVGAGVIGCEFASVFGELGTRITMVEMLPQMLPLEDKRIAKQFQGIYRKRGIEVLLKTKVEGIQEYADDHVIAKLSDGAEVTVEKILISVGRVPNTAGIGLEEAGVETDARGYVVVDERLRTSVPNIYAIGDVVGGMMLAHVASHEAHVAADNCLGADVVRNLRSTPSCTYTHPEVASVGLSEEQALENGYRPVTGTYRFAALGKALAVGEEAGYVQIVADEESDLVLGANMMGPSVTDLIHEVGLAIENGLTVGQLANTIHAHPTLSEAVMEAAHEVHGDSVHVAHASDKKRGSDV
jgi:dihydrolipoamide dehydrogenase